MFAHVNGAPSESEPNQNRQVWRFLEKQYCTVGGDF